MKKKLITLVCSLVLAMALLFPFSAFAEFYGGIMGGYAMPNDYTDRTNTINGTEEISGVDTPLNDSFMIGGKIGYYLPTVSWLGFETEAFFLNHGFTLYGDEGEAVSGDMDIITWAQNVVVRYPGKRFQPYAGVGVGIFFIDVNYDQYSWDGGGVTPGLNVVAGMRYRLTDRVGIFGEYKFISTRTHNQYDEIDGESIEAEGDYSSNIFAVGLSYHFY